MTLPCAGFGIFLWPGLGAPCFSCVHNPTRPVLWPIPVPSAPLFTHLAPRSSLLAPHLQEDDLFEESFDEWDTDDDEEEEYRMSSTSKVTCFRGRGQELDMVYIQVD